MSNQDSKLVNFIGRHLLLDVKTESAKKIADLGHIYNLLEELSETLDMTLVYPPIVGRFPWEHTELKDFLDHLKQEGVHTETFKKMENRLRSRVKNNSGISGITVWLESHAAIHTWTEKNFFSFDAYSCKDFEPQKAINLLSTNFNIESFKGLDIVRSIDEPQRVSCLSG